MSDAVTRVVERWLENHNNRSETPVEQIIAECSELSKIFACHPELLAVVRTRIQKLRDDHDLDFEYASTLEAPVNPPAPGFFAAGHRSDPRTLVEKLLTFAETAGADQPDVAALKGYRLCRELGRGGMGVVFLIRNDATDRELALKTMRPERELSESDVARFLGEVAIGKFLHHPNVVELIGFGSTYGALFYTSEFCTGSDLHDLVVERGVLPCDAAVSIIVQVLDGLEYAHNVALPVTDRRGNPARGVVHRDLKPRNILLSESGGECCWKIADFGLAKAVDTAGMTESGQVAGTPEFASRQLARNFKYATREVDVWAAAATLYFMLTGLPPRNFENAKDRWAVVSDAEPIPIRERLRRQRSTNPVPDGLADVLDNVLARDHAITCKSAAEFRDRLRAAL